MLQWFSAQFRPTCRRKTGMVQNACHSGDSSGPLDGSGVLQRLLPAAERRNFIAWRREPHGRCRITLAPKELIRTRRASEGSASEPSLARRVSMCKDAKLSCRGNKRFNGIIRLDVRDSTPADWEPYLAPKAADARRAIRHYAAHQDGGTACGVPPYAGFTHIAPTMKTMAGLLRQGRFADEIMQLTKTEVGEKR